MRFATTLVQMGNNTGIEVPADVIEALGAGRRPAVRVVVNGYEFRSTVGVMAGRFLIPFSADRRAETGLSGGDELDVDVAVDASPRPVDVPDDLAAALEAAGITAAFDALAPSARKAHAGNVATAKTPETRERRIAAIVAKLSV